MKNSTLEDIRLQRTWEKKKRTRPVKPLGVTAVEFIRKVVHPRQKKLQIISQAWQELLPEQIIRHTCLDSLRQGRLRVLTDDAASLYELNLLIEEGLVDQLNQHCPGLGFFRIDLSRGRWYHTDEDGTKIPEYRRK